MFLTTNHVLGVLVGSKHLPPFLRVSPCWGVALDLRSLPHRERHCVLTFGHHRSSLNFSLADRCVSPSLTLQSCPIPNWSPLLPWRWQLMVTRLCCMLLSLASSFYCCFHLTSGPMAKHCSQARVSSSLMHSAIYYLISRKEKHFTLSFCSIRFHEQFFPWHNLKYLFTIRIRVLVVLGLEPGKCCIAEPRIGVSVTLNTVGTNSACWTSGYIMTSWHLGGQSIRLGPNELFHQFCSDISMAQTQVCVISTVSISGPFLVGCPSSHLGHLPTPCHSPSFWHGKDWTLLCSTASQTVGLGVPSSMQLWCVV